MLLGMSRKLTRVLTAGIAVSSLSFNLCAQAPAQESPDPVIRSFVREVMVDVVVRQKNTKLAKDLRASDFTILEDGVPQKIKTFRFVDGREERIIVPDEKTVSRNGPGADPGANSQRGQRTVREPSFISIVFDQLGPDSRRNAIEAATKFLEQQFWPDTYAAVFMLNGRLNVLNAFTNNQTELRATIQKAASLTTSEIATQNLKVLNQTNYQTVGSAGNVSATQPPQGSVSTQSSYDLGTNANMAMAGASTATSAGASALAQMITEQRGMTTYVVGMRTLDALERLVRHEGTLPGRKTVLYLSEGLQLPPGKTERIRDLISQANQSRVSFYCVDVSGMAFGTSNGMTQGLSNAAAAASQKQRLSNVTAAVAREQMLQDEKLVQSLSASQQIPMDALAKSTGGLALFNSNEFGKFMTRVMDDVRTHYEITYTPTSDVYDGHFRKIEVKLNSPSLQVQSREGYYAMPDLDGRPMLPYEIQGLKALDSKPRPHDFDFKVEALRFQPTQSGYRHEMAFDLATANLNPIKDDSAKKARLHAVFLALIKDPSGQVIDKVSQEIDREVPLEKLEQFLLGRIIITLPFEAPPGRYTIEAAVNEPEAKRSSVRRAVLLVPRPGLPSLSTLTVVREIDPLNGARDLGDPLEFAGGRVTPALGEGARNAAATGLYFVVYPKDETTTPKVRVEFYRDGALVAQSQPDVGKADELHSIPMIASAKLPPGQYEAHVSVEQGGYATKQSALISVAQ
jgi:VWFA-related protein